MFLTLKQQLYDLLRWSEQYTKTDMLYIARGGFWLFLGQATLLSSGLFLAVGFANLVPKEVYGAYQFVMSVSVVISAFTLTGMNTAIMRATARGNDGALRTGFQTQLQWSIGIVFAGAALAIYYHLQGNDVLAFSFLAVGSLSPFLTGFGLVKGYFIGKKMFRESTVLGFWRRLLPIVSILIALATTDDLVIIVFVYFASQALAAGLLYRLVVKRYQLPATPDPAMIRFGKHLSIMQIFSEFIGQADKLLIFHYLGAAPVAAYSLALLPEKQMENVFGLLFTLTFPKMSSLSFSDIKAQLPQKVRQLLYIALLIVLAYALVAPFAFHLLFPAYPEAIILSQILMLSILSKPRSLYTQAFTTHHMARNLYKLNVVGGISKLGLLFLLVPLWGLWGAIVAIFAGQLSTNIYARYLFAKAS